MGRFLNRDPIEEQGGLNLYAFVQNDPLNHWDLLGLCKGSVTLYYYTEIRAPDPQQGKKSMHLVEIEEGGRIIQQRDAIGTTSLFGFQIEGGGTISTQASCSATSCQINFSGSTYARPLAVIDYLTFSMDGVSTFVIDYTMDITLDFSDRCNPEGEYDTLHDGYPSYVLSVNADRVYDFEQKNILHLLPPKDISDSGTFSWQWE